MQTMTATEARKVLFDIVKNSSEHHATYRIQHRKGTVVMLSEADYDSLLETLELLSIPNFRKSIAKSKEQARKGETFSMKQVFGD